MKQVTYQQEYPGVWVKKVIDRPFLEYWLEMFFVYRDIILPYYWDRFFND